MWEAIGKRIEVCLAPKHKTLPEICLKIRTGLEDWLN
jgi:hypothetical protein